MGLLTNQCVHTSYWAYHYLLLHNNGDFNCSIVSDFLRPHGLQHARLLCPSLTPRTCSYSCPLSWWLNSYYVQGIILNMHRYCWYWCCVVTKSCLTLLWPQGLQPSSVHGISQVRILEWLPFPPPGALPDPGIAPGSPALQADSLLTEPPRKTKE